MFNKKKEVPLLTYFILRVNITALNHWISKPSQIEPTSTRAWGDIKFKEYHITMLPIEDITFYHKGPNEFSPSIGGMDIMNDEKFGCVEWSWNKSYFYVNVDHPRVTIFSVPTDEILYLLKTGKNLSNKVPVDEDIISLGSEEKFDKVNRNRSSRYSLVYSNELVSLSVICASSDDLVAYS